VYFRKEFSMAVNDLETAKRCGRLDSSLPSSCGVCYSGDGCACRREPENGRPHTSSRTQVVGQYSAVRTEQSVVGFSSDLLYEIARTVDVPVKLVMAEQTAFSALLETGQVDGILTALPLTSRQSSFMSLAFPILSAERLLS